MFWPWRANLHCKIDLIFRKCPILRVLFLPIFRKSPILQGKTVVNLENTVCFCIFWTSIMPLVVLVVLV